MQVPNIEALEKKLIQLNDAMPQEVQISEDILRRLVSLFKEGKLLAHFSDSKKEFRIINQKQLDTSS